MPPAVVVAATQADAYVDNVMRFTIPRAAKRGDTAIAICAATSPAQMLDNSGGWETLATITRGTIRLWILRSIVGDSGGATFEFDGDLLATPSIGVMLVLRQVDGGAAFAGAEGVAVAASALFPCPSRNPAFYSDLYIGVAVHTSPASTVLPAIGGREVIDVASSNARLEAFTFHPEATTATGIKTATASAPASGAAFSFLLSADGIVGFGKSFAVDPPGTFGLPSVGV